MVSQSIIRVSKYTLKRLPLYYRFVMDCNEQGLKYVSSEEIAKAVQIHAVQIRRDLMPFGALGTPGVGYHVSDLKGKLEEILGLNNENEAILIGIGSLGRALIDDPGFEKYGLHIVALFDDNPVLIGERLNGRKIFPFTELEHIVNRLHIKVGILTVPSLNAQPVADVLVNSGIKAIWNFTQVFINVPQEVVVRNEDLAAGLATLFHSLLDPGRASKASRLPQI